MKNKRREFLKTATLGSLALFGAKAKAGDDALAIDCGQSYGVLVDTVVCIGCRRCEWACNNHNSLPNQSLSAFDDRSVFQKDRRPDDNRYTVVNQFTDPRNVDKKYSIKIQCMHCLDPACVSACIVGALEKRKNGPVTYDAWKCIGCRYCMVACPFQIPAYEYSNALNPQVKKCTFCMDRLEEGQKPACVAICPNEALTFGTRDELIEVARTRIKRNPERYVNRIYGQDEAGGTGWMYLAAVDFRNTELPVLDSAPIPHLTESIQHGVFKSFIPPLALYALLGLIMHSTNGKKDEEEDVS